MPSRLQEVVVGFVVVVVLLLACVLDEINGVLDWMVADAD